MIHDTRSGASGAEHRYAEEMGEGCSPFTEAKKWADELMSAKQEVSKGEKI